MDCQKPMIGGWNDGKFINPNGRDEIRVMKPAITPEYTSHTAEYGDVKIEYEIYTLMPIKIGDSIVTVYASEGLTAQDVIKRLINGYRCHKKKQRI